VGARSERFQFCLAGQGDYQSRLTNFPEKLVHMAGQVPHSRMADFFRAADLLVMPSRTEGLPTTILESLACGVPVMAAPVGDIPDWVTRTGTAPAEYVDYILKENWTVDPLPETMDPDHLKSTYIELFRDVIEGRA
jgi:glycosyltransferase involved in cell wall biosynthesis